MINIIIKSIFTLILLFVSLHLDAQIIRIDSMYYTYNDTIIHREKNRYYLKKLWMSFNNGQQRLLDKVVFDKEPPQGLEKRYCPIILKHILSDSVIFRVEYYSELLFMRIIRLDGSSLLDSPYYWDTPEHQLWIKANYIWCDDKIADYTQNYLKLKDIDASIDNNIMTFRCYKYQKQLVVFQYDFAKKEWSITEDRDLTEAEIDSLGFYADEPNESNK
ncbi:MAG: hypothetical protein IKQ46_08635 [Bacteroidales bacterium]|nr:hypothetical protein [Bacteroidales bacterium]